MYRSNQVYTAARQREILRQVSRLALLGVGLFGIAIFAPNANPAHGAFYQPALHSRWFDLLEMAAAWSSIKIMLFCVGLVLLIESTGTMLSVMKMKSLALFVFFMQVIPCLGLLCGGYYLARALF
jgi:hypothetical protein